MEEEYYDISSDDESGHCVSHFYDSCSDSDREDNEDFFKKVMEHHAAKGKSSECCFEKLPPDPFEEEMTAELNNAMLSLNSFGSESSSAPNSQSTDEPYKKHEDSSRTPSTDVGAQGQYESIYFDSDEDENCEDVKQHRRTVSDADLLYDPTLDDQDQLWMDEHRRKYSAARAKTSTKVDAAARNSDTSMKRKSEEGELLQSDAVLNCPGCLSMLCTDCQRHVTYCNQYRAMFVFNCRVDRTQLLKCPTKLTKSEIRINKKKERQLRKIMRKRAKQTEDVLGGTCQRDVEVDVHGGFSEKQFSDSAACSESGSLAEIQACAESHVSLDGETMEVEETLAKKQSSVSVVNKRDVTGSECSTGDVESASRKIFSSSENDSSSTKSGLNPKCSLSPEESSYKKSGNSPSFVYENTSILKKSTNNQEPIFHPELSLNSSKVLNGNATTHSVGSSPAPGGVLKRTSGDDSSSPSKKVRFSGEIRELGPEIETFGSGEAALLQSASEDVFHPVLCRHCNTKVAVFDKDEVYHFFNVITSY